MLTIINQISSVSLKQKPTKKTLIPRPTSPYLDITVIGIFPNTLQVTLESLYFQNILQKVLHKICKSENIAKKEESSLWSFSLLS
jgi:hypothetical protein